MNSIDSNIQFTYEIVNNDVLYFHDRRVSRTNERLPTSVCRKNYIFLSLITHFCHPPSQKVATFYTFFNRVIIRPYSETVSLSSEIKYLKAIALDRSYSS